MGQFLSSSFLSQYEGVKPRNAGVMHLPVFLRSYSRWLPELKRRERWHETIERVVNYNVSLYQGPADHQELVQEAELMFDKIFHLEVLPAGRTLWIGGTEAVKKFEESNINCTFCVIDELETFGDIFHLLLVGAGTGFRLLKEDVEKLPEFTTNFEVKYDPYITWYGNKERPYTLEHSFIDREIMGSKRYVTIKVGDSREGWVEALRTFLDVLTEKREIEIHMNFDHIRPQGSRINGFGGRAPGAEGLIEMFKNVENIIRVSQGRLSSVNCLDILNFLGKNVVIGGTRRSAQIALGSIDDYEFIEAKNNLWIQRKNLQRTMSNNSITFLEKPNRDKLEEIFKGIMDNGEPGFFNLESARKRRPNVEGSNPCLEILCANKGVCNLSTINLKSFVNQQWKIFNYTAAGEAIRLATRIGSRITNITMSLPKWDFIQKRDRLLGVSLTGIMDAFTAMDIEFDSPEAINIFKFLRREANEEASRYAYEMRIPRPLLVTALKPEGSLSKMPTVSSGIHMNRAPYYIKRMSVSTIDPVAKALESAGVPWEEAQGKRERKLFLFPIKTDTLVGQDDEPAGRQLDRYLTVMKHYVDHNCSITINLSPEEVPEIIDKMEANWNDIIGISFLPKATTAYPQLPEEPISQERYDEMIKTFPDLSNLSELVDQFEQDELLDEELESDCVSGQCPIR